MPQITLALTGLWLDAVARVRRDDPERGDVPGWVLITIMTAGIVVALWGVAEGKLQSVFTDAIDKVAGNGGGAGG